jgi:TolA-binding protein
MKSDTSARRNLPIVTILRIACLVACLWCVASAVPAPADADTIAERRWAFIQEVFNRHDKALGDYLVRGLENYIADYPDDPNTPEAQLLLGRVHEEHGDEVLAFASYLRCASIYPAAATYDRAIDNTRRIVRAEKSFKDQRNRIEEELDDDPTQGTAADRQVRYIKFLVDFNQKELMDPIVWEIRDFLKNNPDDTRGEEALRWAADVSWDHGKHGEAAIRYMGLEYLYPNSPNRDFYRYQRATLLHEELKDPDGAIRIYDEIVQAGDPALAPQALFQKARIAEEKHKDYEAALLDLRAIVDSYPQSTIAPDALLAIAELHSNRLKQYDQAIAAYNEFVEAYPQDERGPEALISAAELYKGKLKDSDNAATQFARVAELYPDADQAPESLMEAGELADKKLGDVPRAMGYYQTVVDKYPDWKDAEKAGKRIEKLREK